MRLLAILLLGYLLVVLAGALMKLAPWLEGVGPQVPILCAVYLAVTARDNLIASTATAVVIGYLADLIGGTPRGTMAFVCGVLCIVFRLLSARLLVRGRLFVAVFCFLGALLGAGLLLGARIYLGAGMASPQRELVIGLLSSLATALLAPWVFRQCRRIDATFARTEREREAIREGWSS